MAKLIFEYDENGGFSKENREAKRVELSIPDDLTIWELKTITKRLASSLGFTEGSILRCFGENDETHRDEIRKKEKQLLLDSIHDMAKGN